MKFGFVTCVELGLACMQEIYAAGGTLDLAITLKDERAAAKSGRVYIDAFCAERGIELVKVDHIRDAAAVEAIHRHGLDWLFIIGWSQIAGREVLEAPRRGVLGIHPTLLPEGRGRAAIPWAIIKGLERTGVTMFRLDEGVDTGEIVAQLVLPIAPDETATTLYRRVDEAHRALIRKAWPDLLADRVVLQKQDETKATIWPGRKPEDGRIDPAMSVSEAERLVRATTRPYPGAFWVDGDRTIRVWRGRPAGGAADPRALRLQLADGVYEALEFETA